MTLESLTVRRLHGRLNVDIDTQRPVFITGPNRAGKSSLLRALSSLAACSTKTLGDQPGGMSISATIDGTAHRMVVGAGGKLAHEIGGIPAQPKDAAAARKVAFGEAAAWSVEEFLAESATKRSAFVAERIISDAFNLWDIRDVLASAFDGEGEDMDKVAALLQVALSTPRLLDVLASTCSEQAKVTQADYLRLSKAVDAEDADRANARLPPGTVAQWRSDVASLTERIGGLKAGQQAAQRAALARTSNENRKAAIARRLAELDAQSTDVVDIAPLQAEVEKLEGSLAEAREAQSAAIAAEGVAGIAQRRAQAHEREVATEVRELVARHEAGVKVGRLIDATEALIELAGEAAPNAADEAREAIEDIGRPPRLSEVTSARGRLNEAQAALAAADGVARDTARERNTARERVGRIEGTLHIARASLAQAKARQEALALSVSRAERERAALTEELEGLRSADTETSSADASDVITGLQKQLQTAQANADALNDAEQASITLERRRGERDAAQVKAARMRELGRKIATARDILLSRQRDPIAQIANTITQRVLGVTLQVQAGEVLVTDARGVTYNVDTASDGERVVVLIALAVAVRTRLPGWKPAIIDRLDALTPDLAGALMKAMYNMWSTGQVDTLIVASHVDIDPIGEDAALDWTRIVLEAP